MLKELIQKELRQHLLDYRFVTVFSLCALLSAGSMYAGCRHYVRQLQAYNSVTESNRLTFQKQTIADGALGYLIWTSNPWNRRPEVLSPVVYGLSGSLGREVKIGYRKAAMFEASPFEIDPDHALHVVLDLAFIVKIILSLVVLLFTHDAICGEKEGGTLRLGASFPVARSTVAMAKLIGSSIAVVIPFLVAFGLAAVVLALSPDIGLRAEDWFRFAVLIPVFALYLIVFAAFGLWGSALTNSRVVAFLGLVLLWGAWIFVIPNLAVDIASDLAPVDSYYEQRREDRRARWDAGTAAERELTEYRSGFRQRMNQYNWGEMSEAEQQEAMTKVRADRQTSSARINAEWDEEYGATLVELLARRRNQMRRQQRLVVALSAFSPLSALSFISMDLARTGLVQQEHIEDAVSTYRTYLTEYVQKKTREATGSNIWRGNDLSDYVAFSYRDSDTLADALSRNVYHIISLALLAILGFAGAYVAIVRYDVR